MDIVSAEAHADYMEAFDKAPDFTTVRLTEHNNTPFLHAVSEAIGRGKPLTLEEWAAVEEETYGDLFKQEGVLT